MAWWWSHEAIITASMSSKARMSRYDANCRAGSPVPLLATLGRTLAAHRPGIADRRELDVLLLGVRVDSRHESAVAAASAADQPDRDPLVGSHDAGVTLSSESHGGASRSGRQELSASRGSRHGCSSRQGREVGSRRSRSAAHCPCASIVLMPPTVSLGVGPANFYVGSRFRGSVHVVDRCKTTPDPG
jgi:hypothetical protein